MHEQKNRRIYRYQLEITDEPRVSMPCGSEVLSVAPARDGSAAIDLWALVNLDRVFNEWRVFHIVGTGNPVPDDVGRFVGTVSVYNGALIFHVFEADVETRMAPA